MPYIALQRGYAVAVIQSHIVSLKVKSDLVTLEDLAKMMYLKNIIRENSGHAQ
jgi:hypothetical protein